MIVIVDAKAILSDPHFKHSKWSLLSNAIGEGAASVYVPAIVLDEVRHHYPGLRGRIAADLEKQVRHLRGSARELVESAIAVTREDALIYADGLEVLIEKFGYRIRETPQVPHEELARWALTRQRPFDQAGSGYRDSLIWATVLELIEEEPDDDFILLSTDRKVAPEARDT